MFGRVCSPPMFVWASSRVVRLTAVIGLVLTSAGVAAAATPIPERQDKRIYDVAGVIDPGLEAAMERRQNELYAETGVEIVVITLPALEDEAIADYAIRVGHQWGVGYDDRGLLVVLSLSPRKLFVATGYGIDSVFPDATVFQLQRTIAKPALAANDYSGALGKLTATMAAMAASAFDAKLDGTITKRVTKPKQKSTGCDFAGGIVLILFGGLAVFAIIKGRSGGDDNDHHRGSGSGGGHEALKGVALGVLAGLAAGALTGGRGGGFGGGGFGGGGGGGFDGFGGGDFGGGGAGIDF